MRLRTLLTASALAAAAVGCTNDDGLPDPTVQNEVVSITLGALGSTSVSIPSAYSIPLSIVVHTQSSSDFDFAYDIDSVLGPVFLPAEVTGVVSPSATNAGMQEMTVPFDSIVRARSNGYITDQPLPVDSGDVFLARGRISCTIGVPEYAKLQVTAIDSVAHTITFDILVDNNCGYRGLEPGLPSD